MAFSSLLTAVLCVAVLTLPAHANQCLAPVHLPSEVFSPLIPQKVLATANTVRSPAQYPQYTDRVAGVWQWFSPDTWTTGFFPSTLYALHKRSQICRTDSGKVKEADWLGLGRMWSVAEVPLETHTGVGHDVGFLSYPFMDELDVYVSLLFDWIRMSFVTDLHARVGILAMPPLLLP